MIGSGVVVYVSYADGLPLYRQETIYLRDGVEISRSLMAQWMGHLGFELQICADYILERVKAGERDGTQYDSIFTPERMRLKTIKAILRSTHETLR